MGSLVKTPKPQTKLVSIPSSDPVSVPETSVVEADTGPTEEETRDEQRKANLLRRERGRLGTVLSGFRGVLGLASDTPQRKTLLGE